jgi:uroporphyrinogen III methyltransferase / synthase
MRILITRPRREAEVFAQALISAGAEVCYLPTIVIQPVEDTTSLDRALARLHCYDWLIFTSGNAVQVVMDRISVMRFTGIPETLRVAAIGPKTAARLEAGGIRAHFIPDEYVAEAITPGLGDLHGRWVLLPTADIAHDHLPRAIQAVDGIAHVITAYHTRPAAPDSEGLAALSAGVDVITFMSGSAVRNFVVMVEQAGLNPFNLPAGPEIACIGPKTAQVAVEAGFRVEIVAETYTAESLANAIVAHRHRMIR